MNYSTHVSWNISYSVQKGDIVLISLVSSFAFSWLFLSSSMGSFWSLIEGISHNRSRCCHQVGDTCSIFQYMQKILTHVYYFFSDHNMTCNKKCFHQLEEDDDTDTFHFENIYKLVQIQDKFWSILIGCRNWFPNDIVSSSPQSEIIGQSVSSWSGDATQVVADSRTINYWTE